MTIKLFEAKDPSFVTDFFNNKMPAGLLKNKARSSEIGHRYQFNISGPNGGKWFLNLEKATLKSKEDLHSAECVIEITDDDFLKLYTAPQANGMQLFFSGKMKVTGNQMLLLKLQRVFEIASM